MTIASLFTLSRILLAPIFMALVLLNVPHGHVIGAVVFAAAALTDTVDGYLARRRNEVTRLGIFIDPLADKLLVSAALVTLVAVHRLSAWIAVLILAREFAVTGLRTLAAADGIVVAASRWGKLKTLAQVVMVVAVLLNVPGAAAAVWIAVLLTLYSGFDYFQKLIGLLKDSKTLRKRYP